MPRNREVYRGFAMTKPAVVLIGGDKGGVGKTTVARTLLDYFAHQQLRVRAFDTARLSRWRPTKSLRSKSKSLQNSHRVVAMVADFTGICKLDRIPDQID
jgi:cellulose biosynthesis protein BcsQ